MSSEAQRNFKTIEKFLIDSFHANPELIKGAKELFSELDCNRQLENVNTIEELLAFLIRRGYWKADNMYVLRLFKKLMQQSQLDDLIEIQFSLQTGDSRIVKVNKYSERRNQRSHLNNGESAAGYSAPTNQPESSLLPCIPLIERRNEVFAIIVAGLDFNEVRSLARYLLFLEEHEINNIEIRHGDSRAMHVLNLYEHRSNSLKRLLKVLRIGLRREDLALRIERLFNN